MKLKELFRKDIERQIQGVIVIDEKEEAKVEQELDEFVVTDEIEQHLDTFFTAFNKAFTEPTDRMGVWISGFFGSGKSHFLKILSYLLDSKMKVAGKSPLEYFPEKLASAATFERMKNAGEHQNDVILFNIDSKSGSNTKQQKLAVVKVFNKVFNEYRGFSPSIPWMAQLEETLEEKGQYEAFKRSFKEKAGLPWEDGRDEVFYNEDEIVEALVETADMSEESARHWITTGEENYDISVESFARRVKKFVDKQGSDFRLVFMADEMGQYISDNKDLMLELQTVVEDLGRFTKGKVWVVVTSQETLANLEKDAHSSKDFSKIQGRFATRLSMSSANADEVVKKRLLAKNETAEETLRIVYDDRMQATLRNKLSFSNTATLKTFDQPEDFIEFYPFVPYQIHLLQDVLEQIRLHGVAGSNVSTGERNLLGTIQVAALQYKDEEVGRLIPFQAFYTNLEASLDYSVRSTVIKAKNNDSLNDFDVEVLKLLFLIRYVEGVPANVENITTLMLTQLDQDRLDASKAIQESLDRLVKEYLVQRNGLEYIFLTNEEQDINREIVHMEVPTANLLGQIGEIVFTDILDLKKYTYYPFENKRGVNYTFDVARWIDDRVLGMSSAELGVRIITPYSDYYQMPELLLQLSSRENQVVVELDASGTFYEDMRMVMQIDLYLRTHSSRKRSDLEQDILNRKSRERNEMTASIQLQLRSALQNATVYVYGAEVPTSATSTPNSTIETGLQQLVANLYPNLSYMQKFYRREDYGAVIREKNVNLLVGEKDDDNYLATDEILRFIQRQNERMITLTLWNVLQEFMNRPYGWRTEDILVSLIRLMKTEQVQLKSNHHPVKLDDPVFDRQISNRDSQERIIVEIRKGTDEKVLREVRKVAKNLFGHSFAETREEALANEIRQSFKKLADKLNSLLSYYRDRYYPGEKEIRQYLKDIQDVMKYQDTREFFAALADQADNLQDDHDEVFDVQNFFDYSRNSFDEAYKIRKRFADDQSMIQYPETMEAGKEIQDIMGMARPYDRLRDLPDLIKKYKNSLSEEVTREMEPVLEELASTRTILLDSIQADEELQQKYMRIIRQRFEDLQSKIERAATLKDISAAKSEIEFVKNQLLKQINRTQEELAEARRKELERRQREVEEREQEGKGSPVVIKPDLIVAEPSPILIEVKQLIPTERYKIQTEEELDELLKDMREKLTAGLKDNHYIQLI